MVTDEIPETELNGEMFCYKRKKNFHEELKKNGNMKYFMTPKGHRIIRGHCDLLYDPKRSRVIRSRLDLLYDPKGHGELFGQFDLVYDPKGTGSLEVAMTYFMTPKVNLTFDLDIDLRVKHLTRQVTTDVQVTL